MSAAINAQGSKALKSAYFCYFLAALVMLVTAWFIIQGIEATEPASPARNAKVASGVLLLFIEGCAFSLAGQWREFSFVLRTLGWSIFGLQIALMTLANYSVGATAGKAAALSTATVAQIVAQADDARKNAATLRESAAKLNKSKNGWLNEQGSKTSSEAAQQTAAAAGAVEKLEKMQALNVSTPLVETIGTTGLMVLSGALSLIIEAAGIVLMHVAGSLRRKASGAMPVDEQILELLHKVHGSPVAAPVATVTVTPSISYGKTMPMLAGGALAAMAAPMTHAAPVAAANSASETVHPSASVSVQSSAPESAPPGASETVQSGASVSVQSTAKKPRAKRAVSAKLDTGTDGKAGTRFKRIKAGVVAGKIRPSIRGIQAVEGGSQDVVLDYLKQLETEGVIIKAGRGYVLANSKGGAA